MHGQVSTDDSRLLHSIPASRVALIERIAAAAGKTGRASKAQSALQQRFVRAYFRGVGEEDLTDRAPGAFAKAAMEHLEFGSRARRPGEALVRVFNPDLERDGFESPHTLVMLVTDDSPFLVDSIGIVFSRAELALHLIVHPVLEVRRDGRGRLVDFGTNGTEGAHESWQLYEIDRQNDPARLEKLQHEIEATLGDVRRAVQDFNPMRNQVKTLMHALETSPPKLPADEISEARRLLEWMEARHFVFLGYRCYRLERGTSEDRLSPDPRSGLGILRNGARTATRSGSISLRGDVRTRAREPDLLILT